MMASLTELARSCGSRETLQVFSTYSHPSATHVGGTCMMGNSRDEYVTNSAGRVYGADNLYVADASVLPGQGTGVSPSLTIHAQALKTADSIEESG
jgi:choline dehydrogenase-like flavoprotein